MSDYQDWNPAQGPHEHDSDCGEPGCNSHESNEPSSQAGAFRDGRFREDRFREDAHAHAAEYGADLTDFDPFQAEVDESDALDESEPVDLDQLDLDRLVDGEVDLPEMQRIVAALEERPDGWRDCALAFLEAQALRKELSSGAFQCFADDFAAAFAEEPTSKQSATPAQASDGCVSPHDIGQDDIGQDNIGQDNIGQGEMRWSRRSRRAIQSRWDHFQQLPLWQRRLAIAASVAVAFVCGVLGRNWLAPESNTDRGGVIAERPLMGGPSGDEAGRSNSGTTLVGNPEPRGHVSLAFTNDQNEAMAEHTEPSLSRPMQQPAPPEEPPFELPNPELEVPFYERTAFPNPESIVLPAEVQNRLNQANIEIRSRRQLVRVQTPSGETVLVPLETVDFVPRESRRYQ